MPDHLAGSARIIEARIIEARIIEARIIEARIIEERMMKNQLLSMAYLLAISALPVAAQETDGLAIALKGGTTGVALELSGPLSEAVNLRLGYNRLDYNGDFSSDDVDYEGDILKNSASLIADWFPWNGNFRLSGGIYHHFENEVDVTGTPTVGGTYEFNGTVYDSTSIGLLRGAGEFEKTTPFLGIGWGDASKAGQRFGLVAELGVLYQDAASVALAAGDCTLPAALCEQLSADLRAEEAALEEDLNEYRWWPVLNVGISFKF